MAIRDFDLIQHKSGTEEEFLTNDPILAIGELVYVTDKFMVKYGDGIHKFSELQYAQAKEGLYNPSKYVSNDIGSFVKGEKIDSIEYKEIFNRLLTYESKPDIDISSIDIVTDNETLSNRIISSDCDNFTLNINVSISIMNKGTNIPTVTVSLNNEVLLNTNTKNMIGTIQNGVSKYTSTFSITSDRILSKLKYGKNIITITCNDEITSKEIYYLHKMYTGIITNKNTSSFPTDTYFYSYDNNFNCHYDISEGYIYMITPNEFVQITDKNGLDVTHSFTVKDYTINEIKYKLYIFNNLLVNVDTDLEYTIKE